ncbi:MAG: GH92 family glycosyl hydrolase [Muribaculaceae bacterium]|nr:GH92 family glycosyl hydrolase [Muribaculaceae bacterium]
MTTEMRRTIFALIAILGCLLMNASARCFAQGVIKHPFVDSKWVNPRIGTGGHGHVFYGANVPFGYVQLGPTEPTRGWDWCSGYHDSDSVLIGFGHQHLSGTGIGDLGDIALLPVTRRDQREVIFSHKDESVTPGFYSVTLRDNGKTYVRVKLTATRRTGMHGYYFSEDRDSVLLRLDLGQGIGWDTPKEMMMKQVSPQRIVGYRFSNGWARDQKVYFVMDFKQDVNLEKLNGDTVGIISAPNIGEGITPFMVKVGLSAVSIDNAIENLAVENPDWRLMNLAHDAWLAWQDELDKIQIYTYSDDDYTVFYTALYHTMVAPSVFCDVNGQYRGADGKVHQGDFTNYTTLSLWDTYRAAHPLQTLIHREKQRDIAQTFLHIFEQQGKLPVWHLMGNETDCMVGNPGVPVLADLVLKGFDVDPQVALKAMTNSAMLDERSMGLLKQYGYIPYDLEPDKETVARGLEYALADWCIAQVARKVGDKDNEDYFLNRSKSYQHYFDKQTRFMRGKDSQGHFRPTAEFDPLSTKHRNDDYCEGNAWQYTWLVPHDVHGLVNLFGGEKAFIQKLDSLFIVEGDLGEEASPDVSGLIGQYAHGNEPSHHIIYMYNYVGQPWKTAQLVRRVLREQYRNSLDGLSGNEDVGQMSAWYVLSSIGLYQEEPAGGKFIIGSPLFNKVTINVYDNVRFTIKAVNNSDVNFYVQSAKLNGKRYDKSYIDYRDIIAGGTLELVMGPKPSKWGTSKKSRP